MSRYYVEGGAGGHLCTEMSRYYVEGGAGGSNLPKSAKAMRRDDWAKAEKLRGCDCGFLRSNSSEHLPSCTAVYIAELEAKNKRLVKFIEGTVYEMYSLQEAYTGAEPKPFHSWLEEVLANMEKDDE